MQTIIATFNNTQTAQTAIDRLIAEGFTRSNVHLQSSSGATPGGPALAHDQGFLASVQHFFTHLFENSADEDADAYSEAVRRGGAVVTVDADSDEELNRAKSLMGDLGSVDVKERAQQWKAQGWKGFDAHAEMADADAFHRESVPVVQEEVQVGKRAVDTGGLRVIKRISETPVSEIVNLREERATIERRAVDRPATEADFASFKEGTLEVREMAEQAVLGKSARVVEEVTVGKTVTEHQEKVSDTVRRTDVDVERFAADPTSQNTTSSKPRTN